jgi:hypothetical protein
LLIAGLLRLDRRELPRAAVHEIETMLVLPALPKAPEPAEQPERKQPVGHTPSGPSVPFFVIPKTWQQSPQRSANGLNGLLFDCAPENLTNLSPQELAGCRAAAGHPVYDPNAVDFADHTNRAVQAARWYRDRARKSAPTLLPCANPNAAAVGLDTLFCLADIAINGYHPDKMPSYGDKQEVPPKPIIEDHGHLHNSATD